MTDTAKIAEGLTQRETTFLEIVATGGRIPPACRREDRARQKLRRAGLCKVVPVPKRWEATELGKAVRQHLLDTGDK